MGIVKKYDKGAIGEQLVSNFFDSNFSKFFSFPNPKTKNNEEVADVLVWKNYTVFLVEVKTRNEGTAAIEVWADSKIKEAIEQLKRNYKRIKDLETINLHNSFYQTTLDCSNAEYIIGLVVLVYEANCSIIPSNSVPDIYKQEFPIHIISWNDLKLIVDEIDGVADLIYYLDDRYEYLKISDIPLDNELSVLGYYKSQSNIFPLEPLDFTSINYWGIYKSTMFDLIKARNDHNTLSGWLDALESNFSEQRKLFNGYPLGLYFAWELASISRRERAYWGEKFESVQAWFEDGKQTREFAFLNPSTGNWIVFYYSRSEPKEILRELLRLVQLKLIVEIEDDSFQYAVYGFGFQVSEEDPPKLLGLISAIILSAGEVEGKYSKGDVDEARLHFGGKDKRQEIKIEEFPIN